MGNAFADVVGYGQMTWPGYARYGVDAIGSITADTAGSATRVVTVTCWASNNQTGNQSSGTISQSKAATASYADANPTGAQAAIGLPFDGPTATNRGAAVASALAILADQMRAALGV